MANNPSTVPTELTPEDPDWPSGLNDAAPALERLRILGRLPDLTRAVAIVGTRAADVEGLVFARTLARELGRAGCPILSGGASGIDAAAHRGALLAGAPTVAVMAGGLDYLTPRSNRTLFSEIQVAGALVSEHFDDVAPRRERFVARNRVIAALATVTVVVQAPARSGALSTAASARAMGRGLFAVPAGPWELRGHGCLDLLRQGAEVCTGARDVLRLVDAGPREERRPASSDLQSTFAFSPEDEPSPETEILRVLADRPLHPDELLLRTGLSGDRLRAALAVLLRSRRVELWRGRYALSEAPQ
ncbi:MAG: DNA-protecting protein DprA [Myxococcota bacterium]